MATQKTADYPARLEIEYPKKLNRVTTLFRAVLIIPIAILFTILTAGGGQTSSTQSGEGFMSTGGGIVTGLFIVTLLVILFRNHYPRWWFDFNLELNRFAMRVTAYGLLLTDRYPSTVDAQSVHLDLDYPNVKKDLSRGLPLVKWLLAVPHYFVLFVLIVASIFAVIIAWFAILFTGRYPRSLFDFVVGVLRWELRVNAYVLFLTTDTYPPFRLK